jgi:hypothetical protein
MVGMLGTAGKATRNIAKAAKPAEAITEAVPQGIVAYHGSPHSFDQFSLDKIGTGEGAQVYGHGLYFADNEGVAKSYRDTLTGNNSWKYEGRVPDGDTPHPVANAISFLGDKRDGETFSDLISRRSKELRDLANQKRNSGRMMDASSANMYDSAASNIEKLDPNSLSHAGSMYQVKINADPEHFLDFDKPLSEQSKAVQTALHDMRPDMTGGQIHESSKLVPGDFFDKKAAAEALKQRGIAGIKYLDQGSRDAKSGSRNYVVFDDSMIDILKKYGLAGLLGGGAAMGASQQQQQGVPSL